MFWIYTLRVFASLLFKLLFFKGFKQSKVAQEFEPYRSFFSEDEIKRVVYYYPFFIGITTEHMFGWSGYRMSTKDQQVLRLTCILIPLYDSFFDDEKYTWEQLEDLTFNEHYTPKNNKEKAFRELHQKQKDLFKKDKDFETPLRNILKAQWASNKQKQKELISQDELMKITINKSFYSIYLIFDYLENFNTQKYEKILYHWGTMTQLANDIFDVYRDRLQGVQTLATNIEPEDLKIIYANEILQFKTEISKIENNWRAKNFFHKQLIMLSNAFVALDQYIELKEKYKAKSWHSLHPNLERKEIIVDMELWKNRVKWLGLIKKYSWKNIDHHGSNTN